MNTLYTTYKRIEDSFENGEFVFVVKMGNQLVTYAGFPDIDEISESIGLHDSIILDDHFDISSELTEDQKWGIFEDFFDRFRIIDFKSYCEHIEIRKRVDSNLTWIDGFTDLFKPEE